jgi:DNA-binding transcriptional regulator YiaG
MTLEQALSHFNNSRRELAEALGVSTQAVQYWADDGEIPQLRVYQINEIIANKGKV